MNAAPTPSSIALTALQHELVAEDDVARFDAINQRLTRTIVTMARSPRLEAALRGVTNIVPGNFFAQVPGTLEPQRRGITETVQSIVARDGERAAAGMRALPATQGAAVVALLPRPRRARRSDRTMSAQQWIGDL